jgi:hypothetical protein
MWGVSMRLLLSALVLSAAMSSGAYAMSYRLVSFSDGRCTSVCPQAIAAEGTIQLDEPQRLAAFVGQFQGGRIPQALLLHSPGGNVAGALKLGFGLRRLGVRTVVARVGRTDRGVGPVAIGSGICASACLFVLMGGPTRVVPSGSRVVVHASQYTGSATRDLSDGGFINSEPNPEAVTLLLQRYASSMGVDPAVVSLAQSVPNASARFLSPSEVARFHLATTTAPGANLRAARRR